MRIPTKAQQTALANVFKRKDPMPEHPLNRRQWWNRYKAFRRTARFAFGDCLMVPWAGMVLGIESDGYTHS